MRSVETTPTQMSRVEATQKQGRDWLDLLFFFIVFFF